MADILQNIILNATGGSQAAQEVGKAAGALDNVTASSGRLQSAFGKRFQHIGLMLFASDALRASGLGTEARQIITTMNMAIMAGSSAFGAAAGPVMLFVSGLAAVVGIASKVANSHKDMLDSLEKLTSENEKALKPHEEIIDAMNKYTAAGFTLTGAQKDLLNAEQAVSNDIKTNQIATYQSMETEIRKQIAANVAHAQVMHEMNTVVQAGKSWWEDYKTVMGTITNYLITSVPLFNLMAIAIDKITSAFKSHASAVKLSTDEEKKLNQENDVLKAKLQEISDAMNHFGRSSADVYKGLSDQAGKDHEAYVEWQKDIDDTSEKNAKAMKKMSEEDLKVYVDAAKAAARDIGRAFGDAFAKMIVEGGDFMQNTQDAFKQMAENIISDIIRIKMEWMIMSAMTGGAGGGAGIIGGWASGGGSGNMAAPSYSALSASGGTVNSGGNVNIGTIHTVVNGASNSDQIANEVGRKIVLAIRGSGQVNYTR